MTKSIYGQKINKLYLVVFSILFSIQMTIAQGNPCLSDSPALKMKFSMVPSTIGNNVPFSVDVIAMGITQCIDTNYNGNITISKLQGPGVLNGPLNGNFIKGVAHLSNLTLNQDGSYQLMASNGSLLNDTTMMINVNSGGGGNMPCLSNALAIKLKFDVVPNTIGNNAPFNVNVFAFGNLNCIDTNYTGQITLSKQQGPGNLNGNLMMNCVKGIAHFSALTLDQDGSYRLLAVCSGLQNDTSMVINVNTGGGSSPCDPTSSQGERQNLGLYGGSTLDLSFSNTSNRLYGAVSSPASLYYSDDIALTWHRAFPDDSLEYGCGHGWGGRAMRVLTNNVGWVAVQTSQEAGTLNALVVNYNEGDTSSWKTAMDAKTMQAMGINGMQSVSGMGLSDYYMYCLMNKYVIRVHESAPINNVQDIIDITSEYGSNAVVKSIAVANTPSGYPIYMIVDTSNTFGNTGNGFISKFDGTNFTIIALPGSVNGASSIYTHPAQITGDTLFLNAVNMGGQKIFRSFNGGTSWTEVTYGMGGHISDVDYSPNWVSTMAASNGCVLLIPGSALSQDLGSTWQTIGLQNNGGAMHPVNTSTVVGTMGRGVAVSTSGVTGPYSVVDNYGLEAVTIKKIARTANKSIFYLATKAGLAYTTAYLDTNIIGYDKWNGIYGKFPVSNVGDDAGVFSVAIDPSDSLHVIVGYSNGFAVTSTGVTGFSNVNPIGWSNMTDPRANDIVFVNSNIVVAVTGGDNQSSVGQGNIWRSVNGGTTWTKVSPIGFSNGNVVAFGKNLTDTVLYAGTGLYSGIQENGKLWKSTDLGLTWSQINVGPTSTTNPGVTEMPIYDIAVDPRGIDTIYIASGSNLNNAFVRSTDGGVTYNYINAFGEGAFTTVAIKGDNPDTVYTAIRRDILMYDALSDSTFYIYRGLPGELVPDLAFGSVLAGTSMGFFKVGEDVLDLSTNSIKEIYKEINLNDVNTFPNPFSDKLHITFMLQNSDAVIIRVLDITGKEIKTIVKENLSKGTYQFDVDGSLFRQGNYIIQFVNSQGVVTKKIVKLD